MSFAITPSLTHIDIPEADILEIYRSKGQIQLTDSRFRGHPCEAFICISRVEKTVTARVALLETVMNSIFVYTSDLSAEQSADYPKVLAEAREFTASFGFTMEKVNLEFSPAMREVIIKGIRVMRPPLKKTKLRSLNRLDHFEQNAPEPSAAAALSTFESSVEKSAEPTEIRRLKTELSSAKALIETITLEKEAAESSALLEIAALKSAAAKAAESEKISTGQLTKEIEIIKTEKQATATRDNDLRIQQLESVLGKTESARKALQEELSRFTAQIEVIEHEKLQLADELLTEKNTSAAEISKLTTEIDSLNSLLTAEKTAAAEIIESHTFLESSWKESQHREEDLCRNIDIMKEQIDQLEAELEKLRQQEGREAALLLKITTLEKETEDARTTIQELASETPERSAREAELKSLAEARNDLEAEYIRMANEAMEKETEMLETLYFADSEIFRLTSELELCQKIAAAEKDALQHELTRVTIGSVGTMTAPAPASPSESKVAEPSAQPAAPSVNIIEAAPEDVSAEDDAQDESIIVENEIMAGLLNEFGSVSITSGHSATEFTIDPDISSIEYSEPAEVLAILYSSNSVQAVPDGKGVQRCKGYVIALKKSGDYSVYLVWLLTSNGKVVICTPEQQPVDSAECTQIIQDAVAYFELVGFMIEMEELGTTVRSYNRAIKKVPALSRK